MKRKIYTSLDNFKLKHTDVISYNELNDDLVEWINENQIKLLINRNKAEMLAGEELKNMSMKFTSKCILELVVILIFLTIICLNTNWQLKQMEITTKFVELKTKNVIRCLTILVLELYVLAQKMY